MGAETYIMGTAKDQANLEVAMKENAAMLREEDYSEKKYDGFDPKSSESYIKFSLTQKVFQEQSTNLASKVQTEFRERVNRNDRDVKQAGFWVLYNTKMPSILIETGFITNPSEELYLNSKEGQDYLASSIGRACKDFLNEIDKRSGISSVEENDAGLNTDTLAKNNFQPDEIVFMVQVKTSPNRTELKPENFKGLKGITEINSNDRFKYASGSFTDYPSAVEYRKKLETVFPDAFVIAVKDNKILPLQQALEQKKIK
jgi:N-acetylmuramoyl-L-alanine amidase